MSSDDVTRVPWPGLGRCRTVSHAGLVYAVATDPHQAADLTTQTRNTLTALEDLLTDAGSGRAGLLQATVYLTDITAKPAMDEVWRDWIGPETNWPQRACVGVDLAEGDLIEVVVTARVLPGSGPDSGPVSGPESGKEVTS